MRPVWIFISFFTPSSMLPNPEVHLSAVTSSVSTGAESMAPSRANLTRFGIYVPVPASVAALVIDLFGMLPDDASKDFLREVERTIVPGVDLTPVAPLLMQWLLQDPVAGAVRISHREDVKEAIKHVVQDVLTPQAAGKPVDPLTFKYAYFMTQAAQLKAWHAYEKATPADGLRPRIEWLIAMATTDAMRPFMPDHLVGAVHSCAVAWAAIISESSAPRPAVSLYPKVCIQLITLLKQRPLPATEEAPSTPPPHDFDQVVVGDRVSFDDATDGPQRGRVLRIENRANGKVVAIVKVDHGIDDVPWTVELEKLSRLEPATA